MMWMAISTFLLTRLSPSHALSSNIQSTPFQAINVYNVPAFVGMGVTSILKDPSKTNNYHGTIQDECDFYVGTKRGKLKRVSMKHNSNECYKEDFTDIEDINDVNGKKLKPYPIFSLLNTPKSSNAKENDLLAGGGDRFITVWETINKPNISSVPSNKNTWTVKKQLGPHTGWVKDLASISSKTDIMIFSIGCNCIEVWKRNKDYEHVCKLQIESSVGMGSTLSSDLLCLATYIKDNDNDSSSYEYLFAGGVDGRLHRWALDGSSFVNAGVASSHDGRVNDILVCDQLKVLISIGNDAYVNVRPITSNPFEEWSVASLYLDNSIISKSKNVVSSDNTLESSTSSIIKIISMSIIKEDSSGAIVAIGTSCGKVMLVEIIRSADDKLNVSLLEDRIICIENDGAVHALDSFGTIDESNGCKVIIGHSGGLSIWNIDLLL